MAVIRRDQPWLWGGLVFLLALALRFLYLLQFSSLPHFDTYSMDMLYFDEWAVTESQGEPFASGPYFKAPLYPLFVSLVYRLLGDGPWGIRVVQILLGSLSALLTFQIGRYVFDLRTGIVAGVITALCGTLILFDVMLLVPVLAIVLLLSGFLLLVRAIQTKRGMLSFFSGLLFGLSALSRETVLLFPAAAVVYLLFRRMGSDRLVSVKSVILLVVGLAAAIGPVTVRNYVKSGDLVLIGAYGGVNLYIGNNLRSDGVTTYIPGTGLDWWSEGAMDDAIRIAERETGRSLTASEQSAYWRDRAIDEMTANPGFFVRHLLRKLVLVIFGFELANNFDVYYLAGHSSLLSLLINKSPLYLPWGLLLPLAVAGTLLVRDWTLTRKLLLLFPLAYLPTLVLFFVTSRYRLPMVPFLAIFASYAVMSVGRMARSDFKRVAMAGIVALLVLIVAHVDFYGFSAVSEAQGHHQMASLYRKRGDLNKAMEYYDMALVEDPYLPHTNNDLATLLMARGEYDEAELLLGRAIGIAPDDHIIRYNLGLTLLALNKTEEAIEHLRLVLNHDPDHFGAAVKLGQAWLTLGQADSALHGYDRAIEIDPSAPQGYYGKGYTFHVTDKMDSAQYYYHRTLDRDSSYARGYYMLGMLALGRQSSDSAAFYFERLIALADESTAMSNEAVRILDSLKQHR